MRLFLAVLAAFVFGLAQAGQPTYTLRFNHVHTPNDPYHQAWLDWGEAVFQRTNGDVKIEVYHSAQLGVEEDIIEQMRAGAPIAQNTDAGRMGNYIPEFTVMTLPYFVETLEEIDQLNRLPIVQEWKKRLEDEFGIHILSFNFVQGLRHFVTNKPIYKPADLNGLRIREAPAPAWQEASRSLGATPVAIPYTEIYSAIQTKAVDGCENVYVATYNSSLYEVANYLSETGHVLLNNFSVTSADWFRSLPEEYQKIIDEECDKAGRKVSLEIENQYSAEAKQLLIDKGMKIVPESEIDKDAFREAGKQAYAALGLVDARKAVYEQLGKQP